MRLISPAFRLKGLASPTGLEPVTLSLGM